MIDLTDNASLRKWSPFRVAHRGGVITKESPENTLRAIELAAEQGYAMVELDVFEAADGEPVLIHDGLHINCGFDSPVYRLTSREVTALRYRASDKHVITLEQAIEACASLDLGVMLDKLQRDDPEDREMSDGCIRRVADLIRGAGLGKATVAIWDTPRLREGLGDICLFPLPQAKKQAIRHGGQVAVDGEFWFSWARELDEAVVASIHENGALAIVSINSFHYPHHASYELGRDDVTRLLEDSVDGFQIDSVYGNCFAAG